MRFLLYPISLIYWIIISFRNFLFDISIFHSKSYNIPIICVGNLTVGGTGKSPHVEYLLNLLNQKKAALITRGYGRKSNGIMYVESQSNYLSVGDEPLQIKQKFPACKIIISGNRRKGVEYILNQFPETEVILMDDGFQHRWIQAGMNIILNDYNNPFYSDRIMPTGKLRDNYKSKKRANIIVTSKCPNKLDSSEKENIKKELDLLSHQNVFFSRIKYQNFRSVFTNHEMPIVENSNITLVTSISNASPLIKFLQEKKNCVSHIKFADHHNYSKKDISNILNKFNASNSTKSIILTTEKDKVKFINFKKELEELNFYYIPINIIIDNNKDFNSQIINYVTNHKRNS